MSAIRFGFGVAFLLFAGAMWLAGCAHEVQHYKGAQVEITVRPWKSAARTPDEVKLVSKAPDPAKYVFVGRVNGVTPKTELVEAAKAAQQDLREKAAALGADVVKIDVLRAPTEAIHHKGVLLAGRAYKLLASTSD
jgi:uncharacterized protein YbjQ (UPF0145 family)